MLKHHLTLLLKFMKEHEIEGDGLLDSGLIGNLNAYPFLKLVFFILFGG